MFTDAIYAYEYGLAGLELSALLGRGGFSPDPVDGTVHLNLDSPLIHTLVSRLGYFERLEVGSRVEPTYQGRLAEVKGPMQSNHGKGYMTHWIYPYKGKFHPQMIRALLNINGLRAGDTVLDPMTGSGTVNVEATLLGINSIGIDSLPIAVLSSQVKCDLLIGDIVAEVVKAWPNEVPPPPRGGLGRFGEGHDEGEGMIPAAIREVEDPRVRRVLTLLYFETVSISRLPKRRFPDVWNKIASYYLATAQDSVKVIDELGLRLGVPEIRLGDARHLQIPSDSIDGIITSPPYAIALDYVSRNEEQLAMLGHTLDETYEHAIGLRGLKKDRASVYYEDLEKSIYEMARVLRAGRGCVVVIGDTQFEGKTLPTVKRTMSFAEEAGLTLEHDLPKIAAGRFGLFRTERILVFRK